jgi:uncharacterized cupredoxin-like copper-binding protein
MNRRRGIALTLLAASAVAAVLAVNAFAADQATTPVKVTVTMTDFKFKLTNTATKKLVRSVPRGRPVVFTVVNKGRSVHDFDFTSPRKGTPYIDPGAKKTLRVTFSSKGLRRYICTVPRHVQLGMSGNLRVK